MKKKAAIELSISFLVTLMISITLLVMGIGFVYYLYEQSDDIKNIATSDIKDRLASLTCKDTQSVCIDNAYITLQPKDLSVLTISVNNNLEQDIHVHPEISFASYINEENIEDQNNNIDDNIVMKADQVKRTIKPTDQTTFGAGFRMKNGAKKGQYTYTVKIIDASYNQYGNTQVIYLTIR